MKLDDDEVVGATMLALAGVVTAVRLSRTVKRSRARKAAKGAAQSAMQQARVAPPELPAVRPQPPAGNSGGGTYHGESYSAELEREERQRRAQVWERESNRNAQPDGRFDKGPVVHPKGGAYDPR